MTRDDVEARLVEAVRVFDWGTHGGQPSAWATDGPWHLSRRRIAENWGDLWDGHGDIAALGRAVAKAVLNPRPDRDMMSRAEEAAGWLVLVPPGDRRLVMSGIRALAQGWSRVPWARLLITPGLWKDPNARGVGSRTSQALRMRYNRALDVVAGKVG